MVEGEMQGHVTWSHTWCLMLEYLQRKKNESGPALSQLDQLLPIETRA